ncbi:hypothetical protein [Brevundimonas bullata]|uniref:hypothetical protein n=1 Tax=Brevundimonas bullata TaxID=13160 RepID=UPI002FD8A8BA
MVEAHLRAAIRTGLTAAEFWGLTPYHLSLRLQEMGRARIETALYGGWFSERFAREERLQGPQTYVRTMLDKREPADEDDGDAFVAMFALSNGLGVDEVEPLSEAP